MVWEFFFLCIDTIHMIEGTMNKAMYHNIFKENLFISSQQLELRGECCFQKNDPKHTANLTWEWFTQNTVRIQQWSSQSPHLNPVK